MTDTQREFTVAIQVIRTYHVRVRAEDEHGAIAAAYKLDTSEIVREGTLLGVETDYAEVMDEDNEDDGCREADCLDQGCPEHPAHRTGSHTYEQHHSPEDHAGGGSCRCTVYTDDEPAQQEVRPQR